MINELSEKDELIKRLRDSSNKELKESVKTKLKSLSDNKIVNK